MSDPMKVINLRFPQDMLDNLQRMAKRYNISAAGLVRIATIRLLELEKREPGKPLMEHWDHAKDVAAQLERHTAHGLYDAKNPPEQPSDPLAWMNESTNGKGLKDKR